MKALALDCAVSRIVVAAKNDDKICSVIYDIGMKQSETIVPAIDYVLSKTELNKNELDYMAITSGPGSFTGLRLGISALKAIELAFGTPVYGLSSLNVYGFSFQGLGMPVLSAIDARKERIYASITENGNTVMEDADYPSAEVAAKINGLEYKKIILAGPDNAVVTELLKKNGIKCEIVSTVFQPNTTEAMFAIAESMKEKGIQPMQDYDGPVYLRESEAEIVARADGRLK